ncbi:hypothetical protein [Fluviispira multicolorata]|uniref:Uncharacterized protein n=1 Tax=Fluviispira multicolorata TaxID=2654512 RepID=A0A833N5D5_9BACT|nr:hypothetical protein [Fluviispira multicolorata]KAB8033264.1 hypothetical protein GCL57_00790 [Fluviispira multicolorata]
MKYFALGLFLFQILIVYPASAYFYVTQELPKIECKICYQYSFYSEKNLAQEIEGIWKSNFYDKAFYLNYLKSALNNYQLDENKLSYIEKITFKIIYKNNTKVKNIFAEKYDISNNYYFSNEFLKYYNHLLPQPQILIQYILYSIQGILRAEELANGYFKLLKNESLNLDSNGILELGFNLAHAPKSFIYDLLKYAQLKKLSFNETVALSRFQKGVSVFLSQSSYQNFVLKSDKFLGRAGVIFVTSKSVADKIIKLNSKKEIENFLGLAEGTFASGLVKYNLPFSFDYCPALPHDKTIGRNAKFILGGFTSGNIPELVFYNVPKYDIIKVEYIK